MEEERDFVVFTDDDGNDFELDVIDYFDYKGEEYAVLIDANQECDCENEEECDCERERDEEIDVAVKRTEQNLCHTCPTGKRIPLVADSVEHEKESACKKQSRGFGAVDFRVVVQREKNVYYHAEHKCLAVVILVREHEGD